MKPHHQTVAGRLDFVLPALHLGGSIASVFNLLAGSLMGHQWWIEIQYGSLVNWNLIRVVHVSGTARLLQHPQRDDR